ncbi:alpha/beta hydrolase family protein [Kitasatospora purpeofusca]|uniref:alpha/beta hydrolase family protein n=1 Tax=Kitasatospora purpeofusca TaxID=67352 RepID=UPI0035D5F760
MRITEGDYASWYTEWLATADRVSGQAEEALAAGHRVSARDGFLRASNYYRSAEFFLHGHPCDPRHDHAYDRSVACFRSAAALFNPIVEPVEIPYEGTTLPGYLYRVDDSGTPRPTLIMHNGFDGTAEELHFFGAMAGVERGYTVLVFDGPGMPGPRHREGLVFRPDWENVVTPVVDFAEKLPDVDSSRIALLGISMGGILVPRAARSSTAWPRWSPSTASTTSARPRCATSPVPARRSSGSCAHSPLPNWTPPWSGSWRRTRSPAGRSTTVCT